MLIDQMVNAVERVRDRLLRASGALESSGVAYAIVGGNAVAAWVASVDPSAVRNTQDVDILLRRSDLHAAAEALGRAGFVRRHSASIEMFLDGPNARARDALHVIFAAEKVRPEDLSASPDVTEFAKPDQFRIVALEALVRMKLTSFRDKDRVHLRDLLDVGLLDASWLARVPPALAERLQKILDTPEG